ncbi:MAG: hypothetical protein AB7V62_01770 [Thermoleophilia bacterium]
MRPPARAVCAAVACAALALPATGWGAPGAVAPLDLSAPGATATGPRTGMDAEGGLVTVWQERRAGVTRVVAAARAPAASPSPPAPISPDGTGPPALAVAPNGRAVAAWWHATDAGTVVQVAERPPGGAFGAPRTLSEPGASAPQVALAADGGALVTWLRFDGEHTVVEAALRPAGGDFGEPVVVSGGGDAFASQPVVTAGGRAGVAWTGDEDGEMRIAAAEGTLAAGLAPGRPVSAAGQDAFDPRPALVPDGVLVAWVRSDGDHDRVQAAVLPPAGAASQPQTLSAAGADATGPQVAVGPDGSGLVGWQRDAAGGARVQVAPRAAAGTFGAPLDISPAGSAAADPRVVADGAGRAIVAWRRADAADPRVQAVVRAAGGAFGEVMDLSPRGAVPAEPAVALDGSGNGAVSWRRLAGADDVVQVAGIDDAPPALLDVSVPASATAGETVRVAVRARDVWSPLAPGPTWTFSAQAGAVGASVEHAFPARGSYTVRVVQADAGGRVAVAERVVEVAAARPVASLALPPSTAAPSRRAVRLRASWTAGRLGRTAWVRLRGSTVRRLGGAPVVLERRAGRRTVTLCRGVVGARGGFDRRCVAGRLARGRTMTLRVRARLPRTTTTKARTTPWVSLKVRLPRARAR